MTIAFGAAGAFSGGTTSLSLAFPASITAGQMLVMSVGNKYPDATPTTPAGWQLQATITGGAGASGQDTGQIRVSVYTRIADGTESGNQAVTVTSANSSCGRISRYTKASNTAWGVATATTPQNVANTLSWSATATSNPGIAAGNLVVAISADNSDAFFWTTEAVAATGCTFSGASERTDSGSTQGDDMHLTITEHPCTAGPSTAPPVYTAELTGTVTVDRPAGATIFLVLRETVIQPFSLGLMMGLGL